jgi:hypothetical protein
MLLVSLDGNVVFAAPAMVGAECDALPQVYLAGSDNELYCCCPVVPQPMAKSVPPGLVQQLRNWQHSELARSHDSLNSLNTRVSLFSHSCLFFALSCRPFAPLWSVVCLSLF